MMDDVSALIKFINLQLSYRHDKRPGEGFEGLDGKKILRTGEVGSDV